MPTIGLHIDFVAAIASCQANAGKASG